MKTTDRSSRRGRPPLPFEERVSGRILQKLGSRRVIRHRLDFEGETAIDILNTVGVTATNEWVSILMKDMGIHLSIHRKHCWRIARFLRLNGKDAPTRQNLVQNLLKRTWIKTQIREAGSFDAFASELQLPARPLRDLLRNAGIHIPRAPAPKVYLQCGCGCERIFMRSARLEKRLKKQRKHGLPFLNGTHSIRYVGKHFGFGAKRG